MTTNLQHLRSYLKDNNLDGMIVPHGDAYRSEDLPPSEARLAWLTGFTGSAGLAIVLADKAVLFVDGRYTLQAPRQVDTDQWEVAPLNRRDVASDWLKDHAAPSMKLAYDPWLHSETFIQRLEGCAVLTPLPENPIDSLWHDRPAAPATPLWPFVLDGNEAATDKITRVCKALDDNNALLITDPEELCWLLNVRAHDQASTPVALCRGILHKNGTLDLFIAKDRLKAVTLPKAVTVHAPETLTSALQSLDIQADKSQAPLATLQMAKSVTDKPSPIALMKARKSEAELDGMRRAHRLDGIGWVNFLHWLYTQADLTALDERVVMDKLLDFRTRDPEVINQSFEPIVGAAENGAHVHYRVTAETNRNLLADSFLLIDAGLQCKTGTTDVTRTLPIGVVDVTQKEHFTRVLKGHIALARAVFPKGTTGSGLDSYARAALWDAELDYAHGTGHGVGCCLSVHEGPVNISHRSTTHALEPGMVLSNEPGYYREGHYGIRIECLIAVRERSPGWLEFENLTLCPIDPRAIDFTLLTPDECHWLVDYNAHVFTELSRHLTVDVMEWLKDYISL